MVPYDYGYKSPGTINSYIDSATSDSTYAEEYYNVYDSTSASSNYAQYTEPLRKVFSLNDIENLKFNKKGYSKKIKVFIPQIKPQVRLFVRNSL